MLRLHRSTPPPPRRHPRRLTWVLLRDSDEFQALNPGGVGRFAAYQLWRDSLGIWGIPVKPPDCVLSGVSASLGQSSTGFGIIPNPCGCTTCKAGEGQPSPSSSSGSSVDDGHDSGVDNGHDSSIDDGNERPNDVEREVGNAEPRAVDDEEEVEEEGTASEDPGSKRQRVERR